MLMSSGPAIAQRRGDAGQQPGGAEVDILIQLEAHLEQDFGFEDSLGNLGRSARIDADGAEKNGVVGGQFLQGRIGQGLAGFQIMFTAEGIIGGGIREVEFSGRVL